MAEENKEDEKKTSQEERIAALEAALAASRGAAPLNPIPAHGAGEGDEIAESWSLYDQEQARTKKL
jgi:hypothetical protein